MHNCIKCIEAKIQKVSRQTIISKKRYQNKKIKYNTKQKELRDWEKKTMSNSIKHLGEYVKI